MRQRTIAEEARAAATCSIAAWSRFAGALLDGIDRDDPELDDAVRAFAEETNSDVACETVRAFHAATILSAVERDTAAHREWQLLCRLEDIPAPGDYRTVYAFQESLTAVRLDDGGVRVFVNVCPHRQTQIFGARGSLAGERRIRCPYHGWTFDQAGHCTSAPGAALGEFGSAFDAARFPLETVTSRVEQGEVHVAQCVDARTGARIAELYQRVRFDFPRVMQPFVPDRLRILLRIGFLRAELESGTLDRGSCDAYRAELRQQLLTVGLEMHVDAVARDIDDHVEPPHDLLPEGHLREALPLWVYGDPELYALELQRTILPSWHFAGHRAELDDGGEITIDIAGERARIARGRDGTITATNAAGTPIEHELFLGLIFIRFHPGGPPVAEVWEHAGMLVPYRIADMQPLRGDGWYDFAVEADAKLLWENFLEMYHFPMAHRAMSRLGEVQRGSDLLSLREPPSRHLRPNEARYYAALKACATHPLEGERRLRAMADREGRLAAPLHSTIFGSIPHTHRTPLMLGITVFPEHLQAMSFIPAGPRECRVRIRSYGHPADVTTPRGAALAAARRENISDMQIELVEEDIQLNYLSQAAARTRLFTRLGICNDMEISVAGFQETLRRELPVTRCIRRPKAGMLAKVNAALCESAVGAAR